MPSIWPGRRLATFTPMSRRFKIKGKDYLRVRIDMEQRFKRGRDFTVTRLTYGTIETLDGQVLRLDTLIDAGEQQRIRTHGDVIRGEMKLVTRGCAASSKELVIPWGPDIRGPYAAEQSIARKPMKEHETRSLKMFMPTLNKVCDIELKAADDRAHGHGRRYETVAVARRAEDQPRRQAEARIRHDALG